MASRLQLRRIRAPDISQPAGFFRSRRGGYGTFVHPGFNRRNRRAGGRRGSAFRLSVFGTIFSRRGTDACLQGSRVGS